MGLFSRTQQRDLSTGPFAGMTPESLIPGRSGGRSLGHGPVNVTQDVALRHSAVWACLRLRADLISTMPLDVYTMFDGIQVSMATAPILVNPSGERVGIEEWLYSSQVDLDRGGNVFGLITERNAWGLPSRIDLQPLTECSTRRKNGVLTYRICGKEYAPELVWHEKQFTLAGLDLGLSPVAYAAWAIGEYLSLEQFALDWFGGGAIPSVHLKNLSRVLKTTDADTIKQRYQATINSGDALVTGADWELKPIQAVEHGMSWIEAQKYGVGDIARFFGCPGDLIDAAVAGRSITYANITQRNLQFLIMNLNPAVIRRERALKALVPGSRFVKLNTDALLRMDTETRVAAYQTQIDARILAPSEARALENRAPFTAAQKKEFIDLFGDPSAKADPQKAPLTKAQPKPNDGEPNDGGASQ